MEKVRFFSKKTANRFKEIKSSCAQHAKPCDCFACFLLEQLDVKNNKPTILNCDIYDVTIDDIFRLSEIGTCVLYLDGMVIMPISRYNALTCNKEPKGRAHDPLSCSTD